MYNSFVVGYDEELQKDEDDIVFLQKFIHFNTVAPMG